MLRKKGNGGGGVSNKMWHHSVTQLVCRQDILLKELIRVEWQLKRLTDILTFEKFKNFFLKNKCPLEASCTLRMIKLISVTWLIHSHCWLMQNTHHKHVEEAENRTTIFCTNFYTSFFDVTKICDQKNFKPFFMSWG